MKRLIVLSDFTESFAHKLLRGIIAYSKGREPWVISKMPPSFKDIHGIEGVIKWAKRWRANAIIGQFEPNDDISRFIEEGIVAIAQDYKESFSIVPNITGQYQLTGRMAADYFYHRGFKNFAFFGYDRSVWSDARGEGFKQRVKEFKEKCTYSEYTRIAIETIWSYDVGPVSRWLRSLPSPVAVFACDDTQAYKIIELCNVIGIKVPQDMAVLGVDNDELTCTIANPPISSIEMNIEKAGYDTAALIDMMLGDQNYPFQDVVIQPMNVVSRISTDIYATDEPNIRKALQYIHSNYHHRITVDDVLSEVPLSRRLLEVRFRLEMGVGVYQYIKRLRIDKFAESLIQSDEPISTVAARMEFVDYKNLSRQFKSIKGCTPEEYRNRRRIQ